MATNPSYSRGPNLPVDGVSWEDAQKFCEAVSRKGDGTIIVCPQRRNGNTQRAPEIVPAGMVLWKWLPGSVTIRAERPIP